MAVEKEISDYVDSMIARAREILREDKILKRLGELGQTPAEPPADPAKPPAPKVKPVPDVPAAKPHWWFGETTGE